jgi:phosphate transport system substrate-binding protein
MNTKLNGLIATLALTGLLVGCGKKDPNSTTNATGASAGKTTIQVQGSDTMVNEAQAWAEAYSKVNPNISVEVGGGGSGVGIAALINGTIDIATASREMKAEEKAKARNTNGQEAREFIVGYDCLAIYVHKNNPLSEISIEQLDQIYSENGKITKWSDLGVTVPGCDSDEIIRVSRQSSSGTYEFFREHVLGKKDFKLGSRDMNGSKEVVQLVGSTPCAIGYSGMGYATDQVKKLKVATKAGGQAFPPSVETAQNKSYPIARPLYFYTAGEPESAAKGFIAWVLADEGQKIVEQSGYVPVPTGQRAQLK